MNNRPEDINRTGMDRDTERQREKKREEGGMKRVVGKQVKREGKEKRK